MSTIKTKPGVTLRKVEIKPGALRAIRTTPATVELLDRAASTIANEAGRQAGSLASSSEDVDVSAAEFAVDGTFSAGKRGRYRSSVRTRGFEAIWAEHRYKALSSALHDVVRKLGGKP